jgi:hypothetical protein
VFPEPNPLEEVLNEYSGLFSGQLGLVNVAEYEIELVDQVPVRSPPYHCAPPKLKILKEFAEELLRREWLGLANTHMLARNFYNLSLEEVIGWWLITVR